ncbi:MAG: YraN family protein [Spirulinaceae cyanobacterium SM2_1_0]|nr:YraN family protein [Spirulinaceae cyanobacterium SM2_1_0]
MAARKPTTTTIGNLGEQLVARWLTDQGWAIQARHWRSRWGELDLIACDATAATLAFVEVKTRSPRNWDADGLLAVTPQKQAKLWRTAELFLAEHPSQASLTCRFDLALVTYRAEPRAVRSQELPPVSLGKPVDWAGYQFVLAHYLPAAFSL